LNVSVVEYGYLSAAPAVGAVLDRARHFAGQGNPQAGADLSRLGDRLWVGDGHLRRDKSFIIAWLAIAVTGAADGVSTIIRNTIRQLQTPDHVRGRMTSVNQIFFQGGPQLGEIRAGVLAQLFGAPYAIISGGIGCIIGTLAIAWKWPHLMKYNGDEPMLAGAPASAPAD
jgi:MFS family permease